MKKRKKVIETVANYSQNNFCELKIFNPSNLNVSSPKDLESFFIIWKELIYYNDNNYYN